MTPDKPSAHLPPQIWVLGFVSLLMDISSEMIHSLLPLFMAGTLGMSVSAIGLIEGLAESTALIVKVFSGALSDRLGRRKGLALLGYAMGAFTKPLFAVASGLGLVVLARLVDRVGKGIRGAPRDALVADLVSPDLRGAAFGLRQSLDTVGAFAGPLLAAGLMLLWANDFRAVFWVAVVPGLLAVLLLALGVREPEPQPQALVLNPLRREAMRLLSARYWWVVTLGAVFTLARFSEAFLVLRAAELGMTLVWIPLVMVAMNLVYALTAYVWQAVRFGQRHEAAGPGSGRAGGGRSGAGAGQRPACTAGGCGPVGRPHGHDAGHPGAHGGRHRTGAAARHGLWPVQPGQRSRHACGQRDRRLAVGRFWFGHDLSGGGRVCRSVPGVDGGRAPLGKSQLITH